jgi:hypothetical protein
MTVMPVIQPSPTPVTEEPVRLVPLPGGRRGLSDIPFTLLVFGLLLGGMIGYLVLQTTLQEQAFELSDLREEAELLEAREAYLEAGLATRTTPLELARSASALGMVANPYSTFLNLTTGVITGVNRPVVGDELPIISAPLPTEAEIAAAEAAAAEAAAAQAAAEAAAAAAAAEGAAEGEPVAEGEAPLPEAGVVTEDGVTDPAVAAGEWPAEGEPIWTEPTEGE